MFSNFTAEVVVSRLAGTLRPCDIHVRWIKQKSEPVRDWVTNVLDDLPDYMEDLAAMPVGSSRVLRITGDLTGWFDRLGEFSDELAIRRVKYLRK